MEINQRPTPPNEWLYEQSFVPNPETGEPEEVRSNWCTQHMELHFKFRGLSQNFSMFQPNRLGVLDFRLREYCTPYQYLMRFA